LCFLFSFAQIGLTQLSESAQISLLTCGPGEDLYAIFGHSAVRVFDPIRKIDQVYNYGTFDFSDPEFYPKFLRGKLLYRLEAEEMQRFLYTYQYFGRSVKEEVIILDSIEKNVVYNALLENRKPENRFYLYDFLFDNCSTRITGLLDNSIGPITFAQGHEYTFRELLDQYLLDRDWTRFGIDLIIGSRADRYTSASEQTFLPDYLSSNLSTSLNKSNQSILNSADILYEGEKKSSNPFWITPTLLFTIFLIIEFIILRYQFSGMGMKIYDSTWFVMMTIASLIISFMWFGTDHKACGNNFNLLVFNPLYLLWVSLYFTQKFRGFFSVLSLILLLPILFLPFVKMGAQDIHAAVLLIALISVIKLFRIGAMNNFRKFV
jgi:hypothetical protein